MQLIEVRRYEEVYFYPEVFELPDDIASIADFKGQTVYVQRFAGFYEKNHIFLGTVRTKNYLWTINDQVTLFDFTGIEKGEVTLIE